MIEIRVVAASRPSSALEELLDALRQRDVSAVRRDASEVSHDDVVLVILSPSLQAEAKDNPALAELLSGQSAKVVPVLLDESVDLLADVSQIRVSGDPARAAQRIEVILRAGSRDLAAWTSLASNATAWTRVGRPRSGLLPGGELGSAMGLLAGSIPALDHDRAKDVRELVIASRRRSRRRRTLAVVGATVVALALLVTTVVAFDQRDRARTAAATANAAAEEAEATRLNARARELIPYDPDLPWQLAADALELVPDTETVDVVPELASTSPAHETVALRALPSSVAVGQDLAVVFYGGDESLDVIDLRSNRVRSSTLGLAVRGHWVSPDDRHLVVLLENGELNRAGLSIADKTPDLQFETIATGVIAFAPVDADRIAVLGEEGLETHGLDSGHRLAVGLPTGTADYLDLSAFDANHLAILTSEGLLEIELPMGEVLGELNFDVSGGSVEANSDVAVVTTSSNQLAITREDVRSGVAFDELDVPSARAVLSATVLHENWLYAGADTGAIGVADLTMTSRRLFAAHRGPVYSISFSVANEMVTVGGDQRLRLWQPLESMNKVNPSPLGIDRFKAIGYEEPFRNMIDAGFGSSFATLRLIDANTSLIVDRKTLQVRNSASTGTLSEFGRPTTVTGRVYSVFLADDANEVVRFDVADGETITSAFPIPAELLLTRFLTAVSPDSRWFAVADENKLMSVGENGEWNTLRFSEPIQPVALSLDDLGDAFVVDSAGVLHRLDGSTTTLPLGGSTPTTAVSLGGGRLAVSTSDNALLAVDGSEVRELRRLDDDHRPFALRPSPDGQVLALIGNGRTDVVDLATGELLGRFEPATGSRGSVVADLVFDDDARGGILVRPDGLIERFTLRTAEGLREYVLANAPDSREGASSTGGPES